MCGAHECRMDSDHPRQTDIHLLENTHPFPALARTDVRRSRGPQSKCFGGGRARAHHGECGRGEPGELVPEDGQVQICVTGLGLERMTLLQCWADEDVYPHT